MSHEYDYTDEEIQHTLDDMGLEMPNYSMFANLRADVNNRSPQIGNYIDNLADFSRKLLDDFERFGQGRVLFGDSTMDRAHELLKQADDMMLKSIEHMAKLEKMVEREVFGSNDEKSPPNSYLNYLSEHDDDDELSMEPEIPISPTPYHQQNVDKENILPVRKKVTTNMMTPQRNEPANPADERRQLNQYFREKGLMRVPPKDGRLPYRVDRCAMMAKYKEMWAKRPPPGEAKRLSLRWKIREWMAKQDIPIVQFKKDKIVKRPVWKD